VSVSPLSSVQPDGRIVLGTMSSIRGGGRMSPEAQQWLNDEEHDDDEPFALGHGASTGRKKLSPSMGALLGVPITTETVVPPVPTEMNRAISEPISASASSTTRLLQSDSVGTSYGGVSGSTKTRRNTIALSSTSPLARNASNSSSVEVRDSAQGGGGGADSEVLLKQSDGEEKRLEQKRARSSITPARALHKSQSMWSSSVSSRLSESAHNQSFYCKARNNEFVELDAMIKSRQDAINMDRPRTEHGTPMLSMSMRQNSQQSLRFRGNVIDLDHKSSRGMQYIATAVLITYVAIGITAYACTDGWSFLDSVYFTVQTITTVGYGDIVPMGHNGRLFTIFYILVGVGFVGTALGVMVGAALDREEMIMDEMITSKKAFNKSANHRSIMHLTSGEMLETGMDWEERQYSRLKEHLRVSAINVLLTVTFGAAAFALLERIPFYEALYMATATVTTVGYGDEVCTSELCKVFFIVYVVIGVVFVAKAMGDVAAFPIELRRNMNEAKVLGQYGDVLTSEDLKELVNTVSELDNLDDHEVHVDRFRANSRDSPRTSSASSIDSPTKSPRTASTGSDDSSSFGASKRAAGTAPTMDGLSGLAKSDSVRIMVTEDGSSDEGSDEGSDGDSDAGSEVAGRAAKRDDDKLWSDPAVKEAADALAQAREVKRRLSTVALNKDGGAAKPLTTTMASAAAAAATPTTTTPEKQYGSEQNVSVSGGSLTKEQFTLAMLVKLQKVSREDIQACMAQFHKLDHDGAGMLNNNDVIISNALRINRRRRSQSYESTRARYLPRASSAESNNSLDFVEEGDSSGNDTDSGGSDTERGGLNEKDLGDFC